MAANDNSTTITTNKERNKSKNIIILGASYGGLSTAHYILKHVLPKLPPSPSPTTNSSSSSPPSEAAKEEDTAPPYKVILIAASAQVFCRPASPRAMLSDEMLPQDKLFVDVVEQFAQYSADTFGFILGRVQAFDHVQRSVTVSVYHDNKDNQQQQEAIVETLPFHAAVLATGASATSPLLGFHHGGGDSNDEQSHALRANWAALRRALPTAKHIVISGGGPSGIEVAGELGAYLNGETTRSWGWLNGQSHQNPKVRITIVTAGSQVLPLLRPSIATKAESLLGRLGVTVRKGVRVVSTVPAGAGEDGLESLTAPTVVLLDDGTTLEADIYIPARGMTPNTNYVLDKSLLVSEQDGRVHTNPATLRVDKAGPGARIYAIGDVSNFARPAVHNILSAIPVLCANLRRDLFVAAGQQQTVEEGEGDRIFKEDKRETQLVPIGRSMGVGAAMGWKIPGFLVWLVKGRDYWLWTTGGLWSGKQWVKAS